MSDNQQPKITRGTVPTHWTPSKAFDEYGMAKVKNKNPVIGLGQKVVAIMESRGDEVAVSQPQCYWERWIDTAGNISNSPLASNRAPSGQFTREDITEIQFNQAKLASAGWLHYDTGYPRFGGMPTIGAVCPSSEEWIRYRDVTQGALLDDNGLPVLDKEGNPVMRPGLLAERRARQALRTAEYQTQYESNKEKRDEDLMDMMRQLTTTIGNAMSDKPVKKRANPGLAEE